MVTQNLLSPPSMSMVSIGAFALHLLLILHSKYSLENSSLDKDNQSVSHADATCPIKET